MARDLDAPPEVGRDLEPLPAIGASDAFGAGARRGLVDRILSRAQALGAQNAPLLQNLPERSMAEQLLRPKPLSRPVDETRFETDRARILQERQTAGAAAEQAHPTAYLAGEVAPTAATLLAPGGAETKAVGIGARLLRAMKTGAALGGVQSAVASEANKPADVAGDVATGAVVGGLLGPAGELIAQGTGAAGRKLLPRAQDFLQRAQTAIADRSAQAAEGTMRSAVGTLGKKTAGGRADLRLIQQLIEQGVSPETEATLRSLLSGPDAAPLKEALASNVAERFPGHLGEIETARGLVGAAAADAAAARSPEAVQAMEQQMRSEATKRLLTRYILPSAAGGLIGEATGGHAGGGIGIGLGLGARPMIRAIVRNATGPAFQAPVGRAAVSFAEKLAQAGGESGAPALSGLTPAVRERIDALIASLRQRSTPAVQLAQGRDLE